MSEPKNRLLETETCTVCDRVGLKFFAGTRCLHTPEEWGRAVARKAIEAGRQALRDHPLKGTGDV